MCLPLLDAIRVPRASAGRPRINPDAVLSDKAYSSRAIRTELRRRGIVPVIPEPRDQQAHRRRRGSRGGRPVTYDPVAYRGRNTVERLFNPIKQWRAPATRYDKNVIVYRGGANLAAILLWPPSPTRTWAQSRRSSSSIGTGNVHRVAAQSTVVAL